MKFFLCGKRQRITTASWCLRNTQSHPVCNQCDFEAVRNTSSLYSIEQLFGEDMMDEYKQIIRLRLEET